MDQDLGPKKGCSVFVKLMFFLSIILNIIFLLAAVYGYGVVKSFTDTDSLKLPINFGSSEGVEVADHPLLNIEQEKLLDGMGIDVEKIPTEITPEMQSCFEQAVGAARAEEIKQGSAIGPLDIMKAKSCL